MRRWLGAALALACSMLPTLASAQPLHLWHAYDGAEERALAEVARAFEAQSGRPVTLLRIAFGAYFAKLESAIPTGRGPDVFIDTHERLRTFEQAHLVDALASDAAFEAGFDPVHLDSLRIDGAIFGAPLALKCAALYLRNDLAPEDPATLSELARLEVPGGFPLVMDSENAYYAAALLHALGGALLDDADEYGFVGTEAAETLSSLRALQDAGTIPEEPNGELVQRMFVGRNAAAAISGPWLAPNLDGDDWRVIPLPPFETGQAPMRPFLTIEAAFVGRGADPEAGDLARFIAGRSGAALRAQIGGQVVAQREVQDDDVVRTTFREAARTAIPMPTHPHMRQTFGPAQHALRRVLRQGAEPETALAEGLARYTDATRPLPPPRDPSFALLVFGVLLLGATGFAVKRARDPEFRQAVRASLPAYKYMAHAFVAVGLLVVLPLVVGAATSFFSGHGRDLYYSGVANYVEILTARGGDLLGTGSFYVVLGVTLLWTALNLALHLGIGVSLALFLNREDLRLKGVYRVLLILPWAVPSYVTALAWKGMFHRQLGAINHVLEALGAEPVSWFAQFSTAFSANLATNVWLGFPFMMVVTLGALSAIPKELYEAADVDGATRWQRFRLITLPLLRPSLLPAVAMGAVWTFNMFNVVFLVSGGEPGGSTEILVSEAYRWAFTRSSQYGYAAAYAVLIFVVLLGVTRVGARASRDPAEAKAKAAPEAGAHA